MASSETAGTNQTTVTINNMKIALIGKTGCGKSATANTILGRKEFESKSSSTSITVKCQKAQSKVEGRRIAVVDTPGLYDSKLSNEEVTEEVKKCILHLAPGPHVFMLVIQIGRFTEEEKNTVKLIKEAFGKGAEKYIIILFTRGDDLEEDGTTIEDYLHKSEDSLKTLIAECGNRFHVFKNREKKDRTQVNELLEKIEDMVTENGGKYYTNEMLKEAEEAIQKEQEKIKKEEEEQMKKEKEEMEKRFQQEMETMKQQGDGMKEFILELQKQHAEQMEKMMERFEEQTRAQAVERAEAEARRHAEMMMMRAQPADTTIMPCTIS